MSSKSVGVCVSVIVAVLLTATVEASDGTGTVSFSGLEFSMACPHEGGTWFYKNKEISSNSTVIQRYSDRTKGLYYCEYIDNTDTVKVKYYFYVQGKVCDNCFELDAKLMMGAICGDLVFTVLVILVTYRCSQKKNPAGASFTPKAAAPTRGRVPTVPSPDYEALDPNTRSHGTYSTAVRKQ